MKNELVKRILSSLVLIPIAAFFIVAGSFFYIFFLVIFFLITAYEWFKMSQKKNYSFLGIFFLFFSTYSAYLLRGDSYNDLLFFYL